MVQSDGQLGRCAPRCSPPPRQHTRVYAHAWEHTRVVALIFFCTTHFCRFVFGVALNRTLHIRGCGSGRPSPSATGEQWGRELLTYHFDRLAGFFLTPPVVYRRLDFPAVLRTGGRIPQPPVSWPPVLGRHAGCPCCPDPGKAIGRFWAVFPSKAMLLLF